MNHSFIEEELIQLSRQVRADIIEMIHHAHMGHPGSSLSAVELLVALYFCAMRTDPKAPHWGDRDRFILSKGHASPALYSVLARRGYFPLSDLLGFRSYGSPLTAYPDMNAPGVDMESGSLGNGLSTGAGIALYGKLHHKAYRTYVMIGDGELQEGMIWEAAMCAAHHSLDHLTAIVDRNQLQINGMVKDIMSISPLEDKWKAFGWKVFHVDGHHFPSILNALEEAQHWTGSPCVIIADTVKGKGISFMENQASWHRRDITREQYDQAMQEIMGNGGYQ